MNMNEYLACLAQRVEGENVSLAPSVEKNTTSQQILRGLYSHVETEDNDILGFLWVVKDSQFGLVFLTGLTPGLVFLML